MKSFIEKFFPWRVVRQTRRRGEKRWAWWVGDLMKTVRGKVSYSEFSIDG
jgi:hypothetical protein